MNWQYILKAGPWKVEEGKLYYETSYICPINREYYTNFEEAAIEKSVNSMLNGVWADVQQRRDVDIVLYTGIITIVGESGTPYEIRMKSYPDYCKFDVVGSKETPLGYIDVGICIDADRALPYGDILAVNILSLVNDWGSADKIYTINEFLNGTFYTDVHCPFCNEDSQAIPHEELTRHYSCYDCNVFSCILDLSYETVEANERFFEVETTNHKFTCPICKYELEMLSNGHGYCEDDRMYFIEQQRYPLMKIHGELTASEDFKDLLYDGKNYKYVGDGLEVEEEE